MLRAIHCELCIIFYIDILLLEFAAKLQQMDAIRNETQTIRIENRVHFCQTKSEWKPFQGPSIRKKMINEKKNECNSLCIAKTAVFKPVHDSIYKYVYSAYTVLHT